MLHTVDKAASSSDGQVLNKPNLPDRRSLTLMLNLPQQISRLGQEWLFAQFALLNTRRL
jgi:hypothetical protein